MTNHVCKQPGRQPTSKPHLAFNEAPLCQRPLDDILKIWISPIDPKRNHRCHGVHIYCRCPNVARARLQLFRSGVPHCPSDPSSVERECCRSVEIGDVEVRQERMGLSVAKKNVGGLKIPVKYVSTVGKFHRPGHLT